MGWTKKLNRNTLGALANFGLARANKSWPVAINFDADAGTVSIVTTGNDTISKRDLKKDQKAFIAVGKEAAKLLGLKVSDISAKGFSVSLQVSENELDAADVRKALTARFGKAKVGGNKDTVVEFKVEYGSLSVVINKGVDEIWVGVPA